MKKWTNTPTAEQLEQTITSLTEHGFTVFHEKTGKAALERLESSIPNEIDVMTGSSTTLHQIGFMDLLASGKKSWKNVQATVWSESDEQKRGKLRREALTSSYFVASANAVTQDGAIVAVDATGSRVGSFPFAAEKLVLVISTQKITKDVVDAMQRIREHVFPLEDQRALEAYGVHSSLAKWVILERETTPGRTTVILIDEPLGF